MSNSLTRTWKKRIAAYDAGQPIEKAKIGAFRKVAASRPAYLPQLEDELVEVIRALFDRGLAWHITPEQTEQGLRWLNLPKIKKQLGFREQSILENFSHFLFVDIQDLSTCYRSDSAPVYRVCSTDGRHFDYAPRPWQSNGIPFEIVG